MTAAIEVNGLVRGPLAGVDLAVFPGELVVLIGANGVGKSTLLLAIAGLRGAAGRVRIAGHPGGSRLARQALGFAPERPAFPEDADAHAYARWLASLSGISTGDVDRQLAALAVPAGRIGTLSSGALTRLALAAALSGHPRAVLADEPFTGIDAEGALRVGQALATAAAAGAGVLVATHRLGTLATRASRVLRLEGGQIVNLGSPAAALSTRSRILSLVRGELTEVEVGDAAAEVARITDAGGRVLRIEPELGEGG